MAERVFVIAEAGVNHNGDINLALKLIDAAADAGADAVKFQTFKTENLVTQSAPQAEYQKNNLGSSEGQFSMLKKLELSAEDHEVLIDYCNKRKISFMSTAFDNDSIDLLRKFNCKIWKIPSGEITNLPYVKKIGSFGQPIILSTGMSNYGEIEAAIDVLEKAGTRRSLITLLHCTTEYPAPFEDVNLRAMANMGCTFGVQFGYSDHTWGIEVPIAAVALGASVIEKHFTIDKKLPGPDHIASLEPDELRSMIISIRNIENALGDGIKRVTNSEQKNRDVARKSLCVSRNISAGETLTVDDIVTKRPGHGISPMYIEHFIGKKINTNLKKDSLLRYSDLI